MKKIQQIFRFFLFRGKFFFFLFCSILICWFSLQRLINDPWGYSINMDGRGYYSYLPALFIYNDPSFSFYTQASSTPPESANFINVVNGKPVNKYFCGEALLQSPFFAVAHLYAKNSEYKANGYSQPYQYAVSFAAIFYFIVGLFFLWKLLEKFNFRKWVIVLVCLCFAFGTNLFHYGVFEPSMSHIYSFATITAFLFFARSFFLSPSRKGIVLMAVTLGLVALLRPVNLMILLAMPLMAGNTANLKTTYGWLVKNLFSILIATIIFLAICSIQLLLYKWQTGHFFVWSYKDEGFIFAHPHIMGTLFSYEKGLFIYTPMIFLSLFGLFVIFKRSKFIFLSLLPILAIVVYVISSWHEWKYGYSFGLRAYVDFYALFAFSFAFLIDAAMKRKITFAVICFVFSSIFVFSNIQEYQYDNWIIHGGAMNRGNYWLVFMHTGKEYEDTIKIENFIMESDGNFNDMEGSVDWPGQIRIENLPAHSGNFSSRIDSLSPYSAGFCQNMSSYDVYDSDAKVRISAWVMRMDSTDKGSLAFSQFRKDSTFFLQYIPIPNPRKYGQWENVKQEVIIPKRKMDNEYFRIYFLRSSGTIYIDDFEVEVGPVK